MFLHRWRATLSVRITRHTVLTPGWLHCRAGPQAPGTIPRSVVPKTQRAFVTLRTYSTSASVPPHRLLVLSLKPRSRRLRTRASSGLRPPEVVPFDRKWLVFCPTVSAFHPGFVVLSLAVLSREERWMSSELLYARESLPWIMSHWPPGSR